ncbi:MAG: hypothetical protein ACK55Z_12570, partial [bacterium]
MKNDEFIDSGITCSSNGGILQVKDAGGRARRTLSTVEPQSTLCGGAWRCGFLSTWPSVPGHASGVSAVCVCVPA